MNRVSICITHMHTNCVKTSGGNIPHMFSDNVNYTTPQACNQRKILIDVQILSVMVYPLEPAEDVIALQITWKIFGPMRQTDFATMPLAPSSLSCFSLSCILLNWYYQQDTNLEYARVVVLLPLS
jgi:hypothetical protein